MVNSIVSKLRHIKHIITSPTIRTGVAEILGAIAVLALGTHLKDYTNYLLPIAAANFLYIALANLLPELSHIRSRSQSLKQILLVIGGMAVMYFLKQLSG